jgi:hypothetical protein
MNKDFNKIWGSVCDFCHHRSLKGLKAESGEFQIGPMSLENIPVVQRNKQKDFGISGMFNYEVIHVYI